MRKLTLIGLAFFSLLNVGAIFASYNYLAPDDFKEWLLTNRPVIIVDIQAADEFTAHHFPDSIETNGFPVKTIEEQQQLDPAVAAYKATGYDVVVVCPRGGGGAKRAYSYLKTQGVPEAKLTILTGGIAKWPYKDMLESN
jgi:rhodanese-related sulfurtransferase